VPRPSKCKPYVGGYETYGSALDKSLLTRARVSPEMFRLFSDTSILCLSIMKARPFAVSVKSTLPGLLVSVVPLAYLQFTSTVAVWLINVGGGVAWAGYQLISVNHMLSASEGKNRARLFAVA